MPAPDFLSRDNAGFIDELYARYRREPDGLDPSWRAIFAAPEAQLLKPFGLVNSYREFGHLVARLDPLNGR